MKTEIIILYILLLVMIFFSCRTTPLKLEDFSYKQEIKDSILIATDTDKPKRFVYGEADSVLFKAEIEQFNTEIDSLVSISSGAYKSTYLEMAKIINDEIKKSDSVNLNTIRTTRLIVYPLYNMVQNGKLYVYDKELNEVQDSIWEKDYYGESLYQKTIRSRFYEGKLYTTKSGKVFLNVELLSGH